ncbi:hypothetical protein AKJ39_05260, partial [candidate division MSBL1 archaeon SCGC-AAA259J03]
SRELGIFLPPTDPARYVARFGSELNISGEARVEAMKIIRKAQEEKLTSGKSPSGTAAAAIYIATLKCGERRTQREVSKVADITEVTVRNRYKKIHGTNTFRPDGLCGARNGRGSFGEDGYSDPSENSQDGKSGRFDYR